MSIVERVDGFQVRLGGEEHSGWLPPGAAIPVAKPIREVDLDLVIESVDGGFLLTYASRDGSIHGDTWHETIDDAREQARLSFGVPTDSWLVDRARP